MREFEDARSFMDGVDRSVIGKHIRNVYKTGELAKEATWAKIAQVQVEGGRQVNRTLEYYNSDATADARGTAAPPHRFQRRRRAASQAVWKKVVVSE